MKHQSKSDSDATAFSMKSLMKSIEKKGTSRVALDDVLVIAIDFGTTYSGAAWATAADFESENINSIINWPDAKGEQGKTPTEIFYEHGQTSWGFGIPEDAEPIKWFKLLLVKDGDLPKHIQISEPLLRANKMLKECNKSATDVIGDYLRLLWRHVLESIERSRGSGVLDAFRFHVVITVPAIWKNYARLEMQVAAMKAGILDKRDAGPTTLTFAPEPETAALATLCEKGLGMKVDDVYIICDAGGGTVDLISYRVGALDPIEIHEATVGTGDLCGGVFIDEAFEAICKERLGRIWYRLSQTGIRAIMKREWEYAIKASFVPGGQREHIVDIPAEAFRDSKLLDDTSRAPFIKNGRLHFSSSDIEKAFTKVFYSIQLLVDEQIDKVTKKGQRVKGIILVGGLGCSPYLYQHLKQRYKPRNVDVLQAGGMKPRTAICRGAIYKGFLDGPTAFAADVAASTLSDYLRSHPLTSPISVGSSTARQSLGFAYWTSFIKGVHRESDKVWDSKEGEWKADNQIRWFLKKGDDVTRQDPVKHTFARVFMNKLEFETDLRKEKVLQCLDDKVPNRRSSSLTAFCSIRWELGQIEYGSLKDFVAPNGRTLKQFDFDVEMIPSGASTEFSIYHNGIRMGSNTVTIAF